MGSATFVLGLISFCGFVVSADFDFGTADFDFGSANFIFGSANFDFGTDAPPSRPQLADGEVFDVR